MYVKVTRGHREGNFPKGDFLTKVHPPIYTDHIAAKMGEDAKWEPSEGCAGGRALVNPDIDWGEAMEASIDFLHVLEIDADKRTEYEQTQGTLSFRYVWWHDPDTGLTAIVTTRNIFILGDNGKTIDRV